MRPRDGRGVCLAFANPSSEVCHAPWTVVDRLVWALPFSVYANPIRITGGSLDVPDPALVGGPPGILDIRGFDGFHLIAIGEAKGFGRCLPCVPGDSLSLGGFLSEAST